MKFVLLLLTLSAGAAACDEFKYVYPSCQPVETEDLCQEAEFLEPLSAEERIEIKSECEDEFAGEYSDNRCSRKNYIGKCRTYNEPSLWAQSQPGVTFVIYYEGFDNPEEHCASLNDGVFTLTE